MSTAPTSTGIDEHHADHGVMGTAPTSTGIDEHHAYHGVMDEEAAQQVLNRFRKTGGCLIRYCKATGSYILSVMTTNPEKFAHFPIESFSTGEYRFKGTDQKFRGIDTLLDHYLSLPDKASLPNNWMTAKDPTTGKIYYYHAHTRKTQWEFPTSRKGGDDVKYLATTTLVSGAGKHDENQEPQHLKNFNLQFITKVVNYNTALPTCVNCTIMSCTGWCDAIKNN